PEITKAVGQPNQSIRPPKRKNVLAIPTMAAPCTTPFTAVRCDDGSQCDTSRLLDGYTGAVNTPMSERTTRSAGSNSPALRMAEKPGRPGQRPKNAAPKPT